MRRGEFARAAEALEKGADARWRSRRRSSEARRGADRAEAVRRSGEGAARSDPGQEADQAMAHYDLGVVHEARGDTARRPRGVRSGDRAQSEAVSAAFQPGANCLLAQSATRRTRRAFSRGGGGEPDLRHRLSVSGKGAARRRRSERRRAGRGAGPGVRRRIPRCVPLGHYVLADIYTRQGRDAEAARHAAAGQRAERPARGPSDAVDAASARSHGTGACPSLSVLSRSRLVLACLVHARCASQRPTRRRHGDARPVRHHRHAARRPTRRLRQHDVATPNIDRLAREGAMAAHAVGARAADPAVAHLALHRPAIRPSTASATTCRRRSAPRCRSSPRSCSSAGFATGGVRLVDRAVGQSGPGAAGSTHYSDQFEIGEDDARFLNTIQKRGDRPPAEAVAWLERARRRPALRVGAPLRSARSLRAAGAVRVALCGAAV